MILVNKITAACMIWLAINVLVVVFVVSPAVANLFAIESGIQEQESQIAGNTGRIKQIETFKDFSKSQNANLAKIGGLFVNAQTPLDLINFLEKSAKDSGIKMDITSSSNVSNSANDIWPSFNFQMALAGGFPSIMKFIKTVESGTYLVSVPEFSVSNDQDATKSNDDLKATITLTAYISGNGQK